ncbi:hypothetical protein ACEWY4_016092 [Coilia grayii]|uniref:C2H2-type domain-containing protein n=1 Tax=Coilia grayii TaxID=363190 RepID=A0ABD1JQV5_9TELE
MQRFAPAAPAVGHLAGSSDSEKIEEESCSETASILHQKRKAMGAGEGEMRVSRVRKWSDQEERSEESSEEERQVAKERLATQQEATPAGASRSISIPIMKRSVDSCHQVMKRSSGEGDLSEGDLSEGENGDGAVDVGQGSDGDPNQSQSDDADEREEPVKNRKDKQTSSREQLQQRGWIEKQNKEEESDEREREEESDVEMKSDTQESEKHVAKNTCGSTESGQDGRSQQNRGSHRTQVNTLGKDGDKSGQSDKEMERNGEDNDKSEKEVAVRRSQRRRACVKGNSVVMSEHRESEEESSPEDSPLHWKSTKGSRKRGAGGIKEGKTGKKREKKGPFICETCGRVSRNYEALERHLRTHMRPSGPELCEICGLKVRCRAAMERHRLTHTGEKPFECEECGKRFSTASYLRIHQMDHTGSREHMCNECGQRFTHLSYLTRHMMRHTGTKPHTCPACGKGFVQKYHLERHKLTHKPHCCTVCGQAFERNQTLLAHVKKEHPGETVEEADADEKARRRVRCKECGKLVPGPAQLLVHMRVHTGERPYSCNVCKRSFAQTSQLNAHRRIHSGEKPWPCPLCPKSFTRRTHMDQHSRKAHRETDS